MGRPYIASFELAASEEMGAPTSTNILPALMLGAGAAAAAGGIASYLGGAGKNNYRTSTFGVDKDAYKYSGTDQTTYQNMRNDALNRQGPDIASRADQADAMSLYRSAAMGNGPSAAQATFNAANNAAMRQQLGMAAGARGGGLAQMAAQRSAMMNQGQMAGQAAQQAAILRAQEMQAAMAGYSGAATNMRGMDQQLAMDQRRLNDALAMGYEGFGSQAAGRTFEGQMSAESARQRAYQDAEAIRSGIAQQNAQRGSQFTQGLMNMGGGLMSGGMMGAMSQGAGGAAAAGPGGIPSGYYGVAPGGGGLMPGVQGGQGTMYVPPGYQVAPGGGGLVPVGWGK